MTFVVVGAGAIGSAIAARLAHGGQDVTLVVRDAARAALIERDGVTCEEAGATITGHPAVSDRVPDAPADVLVLAVKAADLPGVAATLPAAIGRDTLVMPLVNGIPWWFRLGQGAEQSLCVRSIPTAR
jgi:2-dehydropantoate 2-reductase